MPFAARAGQGRRGPSRKRKVRTMRATARRAARAALALLILGVMNSTVAAENNKSKFHGTFTSYIDVRAAHQSTNVRQDQDVTTDLDLRYGETDRDTWAFALSARTLFDIDGRRPAEEPGIYNGIQETYKDNIQPWLYKAVAERLLDQTTGQVRLTKLRLGRQYHTDGDFLWFDGMELSGAIKSRGNGSAMFGSPTPRDGGSAARGQGWPERPISFNFFGGVPVRLFESASGDWLAGGGVSIPIQKARLGLEAYHVSEKTRFGFTRNDDVFRATLAAPLHDSVFFHGSARLIDDTEIDGRARLTIMLPRNMQLRLDYRGQSGERGPHATELDAASLVMGRSIGATRRAWHEYGADVYFPLSSQLSFDVGATARRMPGPVDQNNITFDRYFATAMLSDFQFLGRKADASVTGEAYETPTDWTRTASGELSLELTPRLTGSVGTTFAIFSYDYISNTVRDDVRLATARLTWKTTDSLRIDARYDAEHDDQRLHHFGRLGFRYDF